MATVLLVCVVILVIAALVFGIVSLLTGEDPGLVPVEPDGRALPLPNHRSLSEVDLKAVRFDLAWRGYRMAQVDRALRRTAYDIGYKDEMIAVLEAEVAALRDGRIEDADLLRKARESAANPEPPAVSVDVIDDSSDAAEPSDESADSEDIDDVDETEIDLDEEPASKEAADGPEAVADSALEEAADGPEAVAEEPAPPVAPKQPKQAKRAARA
jgi:DivIVA domain-containing protein